ncbi:unnamed protein product [Meganyctiphanes norvegica]|uniref:CUB domain-containing protein n=1 Tax=Meganyctiphanes norvegica TaxID=48144 RepID=A0AAV2SMN3_MEGNR
MTVFFKASIDIKGDWKVIEINWPEQFYDYHYRTWKWSIGSIEFIEFETIEDENVHIMVSEKNEMHNKYRQTVTFVKREESTISIKSGINFLETKCKPKVSGIKLREIIEKSKTKLSDSTDETSNNTMNTARLESNGTVLGLSITLAVSSMVILFLGLYVWRLQKFQMNGVENLDLSNMPCGHDDKRGSNHVSENSLYGAVIQRDL